MMLPASELSYIWDKYLTKRSGDRAEDGGRAMLVRAVSWALLLFWGVANAAGIQWNQTPGAVYQFVLADNTACGPSGPGTSNNLFSISTVSETETCVGGGGAGQVTGTGFSILGGTLSGSVSGSATSNAEGPYQAGGASTSNGYLFDILNPNGEDVRIDYSWFTSTTGIAGFSESHSFGLLKRSDGCNSLDPNLINPCPGSPVLPINFQDIAGASGAYSAVVHLLPGTYSLSAGMGVNWSSLPSDLNGSAFGEYSLSISVVPIPAAFWLFGSSLGFLGWMRRRVS